MRAQRVLLGVVATSVVLSSILVSPGRPAAAQDSGGSPLGTALVADNRSLVHEVYRDHLRRRPTRAEVARYEAQLVLRMTEKELRATLLGTREFYVDAGHTFSRFVTALSRELRDTRSNRAELRQLRRVYRDAPGSKQARRRAVAMHMLSITGYDGDGFRANRLEVDRDESGVIEEISVRLNRSVDAATSDLHVTIRGEPIAGETELQHRGRTLRLRPHDNLRSSGKVVATVVDRLSPGASLRADRSTILAPIFDPIFPDVRVVAYYGNHQTPLLGVLGETGPEAAAQRVKAAAAPFSEPGRPAVGAFEMIATVAQASAGFDGDYSEPSKIEDLRRWIDVAAAEGLYVILDIQPGRSDFLTESKRYRELLLEPHVGLALDPEWRMGPTQRPGQVVGSVDAAEVNAVSAWLSDLVIDNDLPEKMFIVHQFQVRMIKNREELIDRPGLATIIHADGFGGRAIKLQTYSIIQARRPFWNGFKLFIDEDTRMFQPGDVLGFTTVPVPELITYQ